MDYDLTAELESFANEAMEGMRMDVASSCTKDQHNNAHPRPPAPTAAPNPKKKRRTNAKVSRGVSQKLPKMAAIQTLEPPKLSDYGDTIVLSNPFDDAPTEARQTMSLNMGVSLIGQQMYAHCANGPAARGIGSTRPMMNLLGPRMPVNVGYPRPTVNHLNNGAYRPINQLPNNFIGPNNVSQNLSNLPMTMKHQGQILQNDHLRISNNSNQLNQRASANNVTMNISINDVKTELNQSQINGHCLPIDDRSNQQTLNFDQFDPNQFSNEIIDVEQLMNMNINIAQTDQTKLSAGKKKTIVVQKKNGKIGQRSLKQNGPRAQHHNLQRGMHSTQKQNAKSEKTYPGDQPVILNCQNPHAPPIYPCGICHKEVSDNDQGIICESGCNFWFHRNCLGLSEAAFQLLTQEIYAEWACDNCVRTKNVPMVKYKS